MSLSPKTLCLVVTDSAEAKSLITRAVEMAMAFDAHLTCLHPFSRAVYTAGVEADPLVFATLQEWEESESAEIRALFDDALRRNGVRGEYHGQGSLFGQEPFLLGGGRAADLVIIGWNGAPSRTPNEKSLAERLVRDVGRPVMVLPETAAPKLPAKRIMVGWSDTREATRAAHDALSLAAAGAEIELLALMARAEYNPPGLDPRDDFAAALDRRGYRVTTSDRIVGTDHRAQDLLDAARDRNVDLLVTGAFGHSRAYDFVIGAVSGDLLERTTVPLLMSK